MSLSEVTIAFRLSTVGMGVGVSVGTGVAVGGMGLGVNVSVGGSGVAVAVAGRIGSSVFAAGSGAGVEAGAHALKRKIRLIKILTYFMVFPSDLIRFLIVPKSFHSILKRHS